jgi:hypothetical protein
MSIGTPLPDVDAYSLHGYNINAYPGHEMIDGTGKEASPGH